MAKGVEFFNSDYAFNPGGIKMARQQTKKTRSAQASVRKRVATKVGQRAGRNVGLEANWKLANYGEPRKGWVV